MKVVFLTGSLEAGGLERFVTRVSCYAAGKSIFEPVVICLNNRSGLFLELLTARDILVLEAPAGWERNPNSLFALGRLIRNLKADIVHSQVNFSLIQQWMAARLGRTRFFVTERNMYPLTGWALWRRRFQFYFLKIVGVDYSANSVNVADHLAALLNYPRAKIEVIPNGLEIPDLSKFRPEVIRSKYGWRDEDIVIGYVSRMAPHKGQFYFLDIVKSLLERNFPVKACLVGGGPDRLALEEWVTANGLSSGITFTGVISNSEEMIGSFDICVLLSDYEGMPNAVMEAMAWSKPVIAHPVGNAAELLEGGAGIIVAPGQKEMTMKRFVELIEDTEKRKEIGQHARQRILDRYSIDTTVANLMKMYQS